MLMLVLIEGQDENNASRRKGRYLNLHSARNRRKSESFFAEGFRDNKRLACERDSRK